MSIINSLPGATAQGLIWGIMAIGLFISFKILNFADLTVDGSFCTGAIVLAALLIAGVPAWVGIIVAIIAGALAGLLTGIFHTILGIPPILSGILTQMVLWTANLKILGSANASISSRTFNVIVAASNNPMAILITAIFIVVLIGVMYMFFGTEIGCAIRAAGSNENMSRAQGINVNLSKILGLMISNAVVALAGALFAQYQGAADINMGRGAIVIGLAAIVIGEALVSKISKNFAVKLLGCVLGGIAYFIIYQIVMLMGIDTDYLKMLSAIIVALALAVPYWKTKYFTKSKLIEKSLPEVLGGEGGSDNA